MVVKLTQEQAEFLGTFGSLEDEDNKRKGKKRKTLHKCSKHIRGG